MSGEDTRREIMRVIKTGGPTWFPSITVANLPPAANYTGCMYYVSNETGGAVMCFSDGTNWRRVTDRNVAS